LNWIGVRSEGAEGFGAGVEDSMDGFMCNWHCMTLYGIICMVSRRMTRHSKGTVESASRGGGEV
jgi:hypothetical protein